MLKLDMVDVFFKVISLGGVALLLVASQSDHLYFFFFDAYWSSCMCQNSKQQMNYRTGSHRGSYQDGTVDVYINDLTLADNLMVHKPVNVEEKKTWSWLHS